MQLLTLDLELNKNANGETKIIQIGYVIADTRKRGIINERTIYVNPFEPLDPFIIELTGIKQEDVDNGLTLQDAYELLKQDVKDYNVTSLFAQWGISDCKLLKDQLGLTWDEFVCRQRSIDVKSIYQAYAAFNGDSTKCGLESAMKKCGLVFQGRAHNAQNDALNTYKLLEHLTCKIIKLDKIEKIL